MTIQTAHSWRIIAAVSLVVVLACFAWMPSILKNTMPVDDFVEYWSAGRLWLAGQNPYSPKQIWDLERSAGFDGTGPLPMFNPPWTIPLVTPFSLLPYPAGRLAWMLMSIALIVASCDACWKLYGGDRRQRWFGWILGLTFLPSFFVLSIGQIGPFIVAGLVAFLFFINRGKFLAAGAALLLVATKPHLLFLLWPTLILWSFSRRDLRVLIGATVATLTMIVSVMTIDPGIWTSYFRLMREWPPDQLWVTTTLSTLFHQAFGSNAWLQALPSIAAVLWVIIYWLRHRNNWEWSVRLPMLIFISLATTPYGRVFDQIVLLPLLIQVGAHQSRQVNPSSKVAIGYFVATIVLMVMNIGNFGALLQLWTIPAWYILYRIGTGTPGTADPGFGEASMLVPTTESQSGGDPHQTSV
jgi:hypothetical protein